MNYLLINYDLINYYIITSSSKVSVPSSPPSSPTKLAMASLFCYDKIVEILRAHITMAQVSIDSRCGRHICMSSERESNKNAADSFYLQTQVSYK